VGGKGVSLLQRFTDLLRRWWRWIGFWFGLVCLLALLDVGYVIWGIGGGYVICGAYEGYVICGADESCGSLVVI
jgi:hypothetical protein